MASPYKIDLPEFAGPLDLLLHLIDRQELDITAISLVQITSQYLRQIESMKKDRVDHLIDFLVIVLYGIIYNYIRVWISGLILYLLRVTSSLSNQ